MEDLIIIKRSSHLRCRTNNQPIIKLELNGSRFLISQVVADAMKLKEGDGVMLAINQKHKLAYIFKDNDADAFKLSRKDKFSLRFTSKECMHYLDDVFDLLGANKKAVVLEVDTKPNEKNMHPLIFLT